MFNIQSLLPSSGRGLPPDRGSADDSVHSEDELFHCEWALECFLKLSVDRITPKQCDSDRVGNGICDV